jgi:hypothetical protein
MHMSHILRFAKSTSKSGGKHASKDWKSGSKWGKSELQKYNITIQRQSPREFFSLIPTELPRVDQVFITRTLATPKLSKSCFQLFQYLDLASQSNAPETAIDNFAHELLCTIGFKEQGIVLRMHHMIPLFMHGEDTSAQTNLCLFHGTQSFLLLHENKMIGSSRDPEPQVIAEAIAAFQFNNDVLQNPDYKIIECCHCQSQRTTAIETNNVVKCLQMKQMHPQQQQQQLEVPQLQQHLQH